MPLPDRPVAGADIETEWGQAVHDYTFAPTGGEFTTVTTRTVGSTAGGFHCHLDIATDDPAGFLALGDALEVPAGAEGLYFAFLRLDSVNGDADVSLTRAFLRINGVNYTHGDATNEGGTHVIAAVNTLIPLTAGDIIEVYAQQKDSATDPTVKVLDLRLLRAGAGYGA